MIDRDSLIAGITLGFIIGVLLTGWFFFAHAAKIARPIQRDIQGPVWPGPQPIRIKVLTTGYCSGQGLRCGIHPRWDDGYTASNVRVKRGICASDWRVFPRGTVLRVPGYGPCRVEDTGNAVRGRHVDLYFHSRREAVQWGRRHLTVEIERWGL